MLLPHACAIYATLYCRHAPFSIVSTRAGVATPACKMYACVMLPLVGTIAFRTYIHTYIQHR